MPLLTTGAGAYPAAAGGGSFTLTAVASPAILIGSGATATYSVTLGAGSAGRIIVVCAATTGGTGAITGVTLASNAMTQAVQAAAGPGNRFTTIFYLVDAVSNASTSIVVTSATSLNTNGIIVYSITGAGSSTPNTNANDVYNYNADPQLTSSALTINSGGGSIVFGMSETVGLTPTWNNSTQDFLTTNTGLLVASSHTTTTGTVTPSVNASSQGWGMVAASWS